MFKRTTYLAAAFAFLLAVPAHAEPLIDLEHALTDAQKRADAVAKDQEHLHQATLTALRHLQDAEASGNAGARARAAAAFTIADSRENAALIGILQGQAALRRARQALNEAVAGYVEQGEALENAAQRAARGEVAPSVSDHIACDGPDCVPIAPLEHAALVTIGAVGPSFDTARWPPLESAAPFTVVAYAPQAMPLANLRRASEAADARARDANVKADAAHRAVQGNATDAAAVTAYAAARAAADTATHEKAAADAALAETAQRFADEGRALKRAALLAADGYILRARYPAQSHPSQICNPSGCQPAAGVEAAAFAVIGAVEDRGDAIKLWPGFIAENADRTVVFH